MSLYNEYLLYAKKNQKEQSFYTLRYDFEKDILPFFKDYKLSDINSKLILEWEEYIISLNYSYNFNRNLYYLLSGFFEYCRKFYNFDKSIISNVGCFKRKYEEDKHDFYTLNEFKQFIKCVDDNIYKQFFSFMFFCGTRPGEAMALRFSDLKDNYVTINKTISSHGKRNIGTPKTLSSNRVIPIDKKLCKDLLKLQSFYQKKYNDFEYDYYIFGGKKPLNSSSINRKKKEACEMARIRPITLHQFRHSHASLLINSNVPIAYVSKRLGHAKISTTLDVYTHTSIEQEKRVLYTLNSMRYNSWLARFKDFISNILKHL